MQTTQVLTTLSAIYYILLKSFYFKINKFFPNKQGRKTENSCNYDIRNIDARRAFYVKHLRYEKH